MSLRGLDTVLDLESLKRGRVEMADEWVERWLPIALCYDALPAAEAAVHTIRSFEGQDRTVNRVSLGRSDRLAVDRWNPPPLDEFSFSSCSPWLTAHQLAALQGKPTCA